MKFEILAEADAELQQAAQWYESREPGLGHRLLDQTYAAFDLIAAHPLRYPQVMSDKRRKVRRLLLNRFPYAIIYEIFRGHPVVLAISHTARRPGYWRKRRQD